MRGFVDGAHRTASVFDRTVDSGASAVFATVGRSDPQRPLLVFTQVPDRTSGKNSVHIDRHADDRAAQVERAIGLGAKHVADVDEYGARWTTLVRPRRQPLRHRRGG